MTTGGSLIEHPRPAFSTDDARRLLRTHFGLDGTLSPLDSERDQNLHVVYGARAYTFKIVNAAEPPEAMAFQTALLRHVEACAPDLPLPRVVPALDGGDVATAIGPTGETHALRVVTYLPGTPMAKVAASPALVHQLGRALGRLDAALQSFGHPGAFRRFDWHIAEAPRARARVGHVRDDARRALLAGVLDRVETHVLPALPRLRHSVIHNDANDWNVLIDEPGRAIAGLIDIGDAVFAPTVADLAVAAAYALLGAGDPLATLEAIVRGCHEALPLTPDEQALLPDLIAARLAISVSISAMRQSTSDDPYLFVSEAPAWDRLAWLASADGVRVPQVIARACGSTALPARRLTAEVAAARTSRLGPNVKLSYAAPLHIVQGDDVWLVGADGRRYLDCYNNVAHVGHAHPRVVAAMTAQASRLNTNTRYLHENVVAYADRLRATLPPSLDTFFFVNSGSEANDLALRLVRTATGRRDMVVLDWAYHGHTQALIDISPYKYKRAGGAGRPPFVHELPLPEPYRAPDDWPAFEHGARFGAAARRDLAALATAGVAPAGFIAETIPSVGGQVFLPDDYLGEVYAAVRAMGGLCIADEVQVGFGRIGTRMWAFEAHGVVPDVVTMGKPAGAGHPLGVVVATRAIANAFANGMEYFNTFGGNPVSMAVGLAVLDVIADQDLMANAREEGAWLLHQFRVLADRHPRIGDVRGQGLFFGLEMVTDRRTKQHDLATAAAVVRHALELGVLMGTDGPLDNVVKLRPPMTFTRAHSTMLVDVLARALERAGA
ncbi:MAG: aminotransferase class III-fold pyridoxal phosphate-dependent enzyme [Vicinamibacterales bacterium]